MDSKHLENSTKIDDLPDEVITKIFSYLPQPKLLTHVRLVSERWNAVSVSPSLWRTLDMDVNFQSQFENIAVPNSMTSRGSVFQHIWNFKMDIRMVEYFLQLNEIFPNVRYLEMYFINNYSFSPSYWVRLQSKYRGVLEGFPNIQELVFKGIANLYLYDCLHFNLDFCKQLKSIKIDIHHEPTVVLHRNNSGIELQNKQLRNIFKVLPNIARFGSIESMYNGLLQKLLMKSEHLTSLELTNCCQIDQDVFSEIPDMLSLSGLILDNTYITDSCLEMIVTRTPNLLKLSVINCVYVTDVGFLHVSSNCKHIQTLLVDKDERSSSRNITNLGVEYIANGCQDLKHFVAKYCQSINDNGLISLANLCTHLQVLKLAGCSGMSDVGLEAIANSCSLLSYLNLNKCLTITHKGVNALIKNCIWLNTLKLDGCIFIKDLKIDFDAGKPDTILNPDLNIRRHSHLRRLSLCFCSNIDDSSLYEIATSCPDLREIYLTGISRATDNGIVHLLQKCKFAKIIDISGGSTLGSSPFTNGALDAVVKYGCNMETISVKKNFNIDIDGLLRLLGMSSSIRRVELSAWKNKYDGISLQECQKLIGVLNQRVVCGKMQHFELIHDGKSERLTNKKHAGNKRVLLNVTILVFK